MYKKRIIDSLIDLKAEAFNAITLIGPKGSGKTTTAEQRCKSVFKFQNEDVRDNLLKIVDTKPSALLSNPKPILFDEWQDAPKIWGAVRQDSDDNPSDFGSYYLTGSSSSNVKTPHTGTMRITKVKMLPMSLFETGESNGAVGLRSLFETPYSFSSCSSSLSFEQMVFALCRGGWPRILSIKNPCASLLVAKDLYEQTYEEDISKIDGVKRNPSWAKSILKSYARNICTLADTKTIFTDSSENSGISERSFYEYFDALERLYIIDDIEAWCPAIRSKTVIRSSKKRNFVDPSIAVAAMGVSPDYFNGDFNTLGFLFESLCIRDLKIYSAPLGGTVSYYRDRYGLEADAVVHLEDGRYALVECKLGGKEIDEGAEHLCELERLIDEEIKANAHSSLNKPSLKIILTALQNGYRRDDGVLVIPIGCLKD